MNNSNTILEIKPKKKKTNNNGNNNTGNSIKKEGNLENSKQ